MASYAGSPNWTIIMTACENSDPGSPVAALYRMIASYWGPLYPNFLTLL